MCQIRRYATGPVRISAHLLTELDWLLDMDTAAPRATITPLADRLRDYNRDLDYDTDIDCTEGVHGYLRVLDVDAVQRLRGWHRLQYGTVTVDARWVCEVRNLLDGLLYSWGVECEDYLETLNYDPAERAIVGDAVKDGRCCNRCVWCQFLVMRDRLDVLLDAQGIRAPSYYDPPPYDPEAVWRDQVMADVPTSAAA